MNPQDLFAFGILVGVFLTVAPIPFLRYSWKWKMMGDAGVVGAIVSIVAFVLWLLWPTTCEPVIFGGAVLCSAY